MTKVYYDTETCGYHGPIVLLQYQFDYDDEICLWCPWTEKIKDTLELIEEMMECTTIGFNLAFDHFHLCQMYTTLLLMGDKDEYLDNCVQEYAEKESKGRFGPCLKPEGALDLFLHARKGPYQSTMDRSDVRIKRVPTPLAWMLAGELSERVKLKDVYFARRKDSSVRWQVQDITDDTGSINPNFKDIVLKFAPSSALKALANDALGIDTDDILMFHDVELSDKVRPEEKGYAPFYPHSTWPEVIHHHIAHWGYHQGARRYAADDVKYTRMLYRYFAATASGLNELEARQYSQGTQDLYNLDANDDDSVLACCIAAVRWRGFKVDIEAMTNLRDAAQGKLNAMSFNFNSTAVVRKYLYQVMSAEERIIIQDSTKGVLLEEIAKWTQAEVCDDCYGEGCEKCRDGLVESSDPHPAARRAREILDARHAGKEIELYDKLIDAGRFHASFKVIGTLSSRMSGADGLNPQGIKRDSNVRRCFPLADGDLELDGGDFAGFEVSLIDAVYEDPDLRNDLQTGKKIHALFGQHLFPDLDYDQICASKGADDPWQDYYTRSKNGVFALCYGGEGYTLSNRVGVPEEVANEAYQKFISTYKKFGLERQRYFDMFRTMRQPGGIGSKVEWHEPCDYIESLFGFRRYFTLENQICKALFELAESPPKEWQDIKFKVVRRDREQTACGALRSALFAAAFAVQGSNMRAAGNHVIQSSGAQITKRLQRRIWDLQPAGIAIFRVQPMNIHDEVMVAVHPRLRPQLDEVVKETVDYYKPSVPLIEMDWTSQLSSWAEK